LILITGITGLTGRFLYEEIKHRMPNLEVKYLVRNNSNISFMSKEDIDNRIVFANIENINELEQAFESVEMIIHLAYITNSEYVTEACLRKGVKRVFFVNTTGMYSKYKAYAKMYIELEKKMKSSGLIYTIIRPTMIYGNQQDVNIHKLVKLINKCKLFPVIGKGSGLMHPIYASDLAKVILTAFERETVTRYKEYNVAGKYPITYFNLLNEISIAMQKKVFFIHIPYCFALVVGKLADYIPNGIIDYEKVKRLLEDKNFDYSLAAQELDFNPITFGEGIRLEVESLRKAGMI
jgi:nucleoside-diphosphate-sugar epimerase